ncbi:MAG TPA: acetylglutamate kinase, partial [bacterium]|nr:acetylglutamate kinase [bacterium]
MADPMAQHIKQAEVLIEALPYIQQFRDCVFVIKYGGSAMVRDELKASVLLDLLLLKFVGIKPVVVHGGGKQISALLKKVGKQPTFIDGLRVTDAETMDIVEMVLAGNINKEIVADLNRRGGRAVGLTGKDGDILLAKKIAAKVDYGQVGEVDKINTDLVQLLFDRDYIPV